MSDTALPTPNKPVGRRTIAKGLAWSVPAIAVASPARAMAASGCIVQTNFDGLQVGTCPDQLTFLPSAVTATISYSATPGDTCRVARTNPGGGRPPWNYIEVEMLSPITEGRSVTVTITLSQAMENLAFTIHDIDRITNQWNDWVIVNTPGFTYTRGGNITGVGTPSDPFRSSINGDNPISSGLGDVRLRWAGPIDTVSFTYRAGSSGYSANQHIGLGNISFSDCVVLQASPSMARSSAQSEVPVSTDTSVAVTDGTQDL